MVDSFNQMFTSCCMGWSKRGCTNSREIQNESLAMSVQMFELYPYKQIIAIGSQAEYGFIMVQWMKSCVAPINRICLCKEVV